MCEAGSPLIGETWCELPRGHRGAHAFGRAAGVAPPRCVGCQLDLRLVGIERAIAALLERVTAPSGIELARIMRAHFDDPTPATKDRALAALDRAGS